jgi:glycosyltransferase involved in cell wall biosynthesis
MSREKDAIQLSMVIPLLNEAESLKPLYDEIRAACESAKISYEVCFVDDGSTDDSMAELEALHAADARARVIQLRRNYGKAEALSAGFSMARGEYIITMDADLQDDPTEIPALIAKLEEGYDLVSGWKKSRKDPINKRFPSKVWNGLVTGITGLKLHDFNCGLKIYRRKVVESIHVYGELHRYMPVLGHLDGFRVGEMVVNHRARQFGQSKYGFSRIFKGFLDLITVKFLSQYTKRPLHLFGGIGLIFSTIGGAITLYLIILRILNKIFLSNRPLLFIGVLLLILGIQFISIGLLGEMITRNSAERRTYSIRKILGE